MGRFIDFDNPLSDEDKAYLRSRGRANQIEANDRRFGPGGVAETNPELESAGSPADSAHFDTDVRDEAVYDVGGVPLPGNILNKDTGQVIPLTSRTDEGFDITDEQGNPIVDPDHFDDDIIESVEGLKVEELKKALKAEKVEFESGDNKEKLQDRLIIARQDKRNAERPAPPSIHPDESQQYLDPARGDTFDLPQTPNDDDDSDDDAAVDDTEEK